LRGKSHNVYAAIIDEAMIDLVDRHVAIRENETVPYGDREMHSYRRGPALNEERCHDITGIGLGDLTKYNQLFPI
jgi:hypothetical protein